MVAKVCGTENFFKIGEIAECYWDNLVKRRNTNVQDKEKNSWIDVSEQVYR